MYAGVPIDVPTSVIVPRIWPRRLGRFARRRDRFRDAEVGHGRRAAGEQDVVRLDVAVDDAAAVRVDERARDVLENAHRFAHRERSAREARAQRLAFDERHDEERETVGLSRAQHRHDVRMLQRRREHDLALEAVHGDRGGELVREHLHDDHSSERVVLRDETRRHPSTAKFAIESVGGTEGALELVSENSHVECGEAAGYTNLRPAHHVRQQESGEWLRRWESLTESGPRGSVRFVTVLPTE